MYCKAKNTAHYVCAYLDFYAAVAPAPRTKEAHVLEELLSHGIACVIECTVTLPLSLF